VFAENSRRFKAPLLAFILLGGVRWLNRTLSIMAQNSWRTTIPNDWDWSKEVAVVTGGSSGIGQAVVQRLAAKGLTVTILDVQDPPESLKDQHRTHFYKCDISKPEAIAAAAEAIRNELGHPTILVNNAGISHRCAILELSDEALQQLFAINCFSHWYTVKQFLPDMIKHDKGHVITVASSASFIAVANAGDYSSSKSAVRAFHETLGTELKHIYDAPNVLTTAVHTEFVKTPILKDQQAHLDKEGVFMLDSDFVADKIVDRIMSRTGGDLILPESHSFVAGLRTWPAWLQELARDKMGRRARRRRAEIAGAALH
jgi:NAD(P)-dependent dehydrogenase (short-subunit alcohol dehydrogenase family)